MDTFVSDCPGLSDHMTLAAMNVVGVIGCQHNCMVFSFLCAVLTLLWKNVFMKLLLNIFLIEKLVW